MNQLTFPVTESAAKKAGIKYSSEENKNSKFASRLRDLRKNAGLSQETLSRILGCSKSTLGQYETGDTLPDAKTLESMAVIFSVSADYLLCLSDTKTPNIKAKEIIAQTGLSEKAFLLLQAYQTKPAALKALNCLLEDPSFFGVCTALARLIETVPKADKYEHETPYLLENLHIMDEDPVAGFVIRGVDVCKRQRTELIEIFSDQVDSITGMKTLCDYVKIKQDEGLSSILNNIAKKLSEDQ